MGSSEFLQTFLTDQQTSFLSILLLFFARILPIMTQAPFFAATLLPAPIKALFTLVLFLIMVPKLWTAEPLPHFYHPQLIPYIFKELVVGFTLGFLSSIPFHIATASGMLVDFQRGSSSLSASDPTMRSQSSPLGLIYNQIFIVIFFLYGGPNHFIDAIVSSYEALPIDQFPSMMHLQSDSFLLWKQMIGLGGYVLKMFLQFAAPAILAVLMTDTFLGVANRLAPQVQITFLGMPLKSLVGLSVLAMAWKLVFEEMTKEGFSWLRVIDRIIAYLGV